MFVDEIEIEFKAGNGGAGRVSFYAGKHSGPDGGNGGDGGNVYVTAYSQVTNLNHLLGKSRITAENGEMGGLNKSSGGDAKDLEIFLPVGSLLKDEENQEEIELTRDSEKVLVCKGGYGGRGNEKLKSASNTTPREAEKGAIGEKRKFKIIVRMIADFGLIGLPNAGKSSLLNELTNAKVKVAGYSFTTLEPNLGALNRKVIADIPGLIEGASDGKGLGINFLKHIEKVFLLLHCISSESENIVNEYATVMEELEKYNPELAHKKQLVLLTKSDLIDVREIEQKKKQLKKFHKPVLAVSIHDYDSLEELKKALQTF